MILITKPDCPKCDKIKVFLAEHGVSALVVGYDDLDLDTVTLLADNEMLSGDVPILIDGERCLQGYINIKKYVEEKK